MIVTSKVKLDLDRNGLVCRVDAVQGDTNTREVALSLYAGGIAWKVPDGVTVQIRYRKADRTGGAYDTLPDGTQAWSISENTVTVILAPQMLTVKGEVKMQVVLLRGEESLATFSVSVDVQEDPSIGAVKSQDYVNMRGWLVEQLDGALEAAAESGAFVPEIGVGMVTALASDRSATASITQNGKAAVLNLGIPAGYTPVKGVDYWTEAEREEMQAALKADLAARVQQLTPEFADSVDACTDADKVYVLPDGYLYAYMNKHVFSKTNEYNPDTAKLNYRINSSGIETAYDGALLLPMIEVDMANPYIVKVSGVTLQLTYDAYAIVTYYDANKSRLGYCAWDGDPMYTLENGVYAFNLYDGGYPTAKYVRIWLGIGGTTALTAKAVENLYVEFTPKTTSGTVTGWQSTGHAFVPADYEDRIITVEDQTEKNAENIDALEQKVETISEGKSVAAYPAVWDDAVAACVEKIKALQVGRNCVTFPFFSDNHQRLGYSGALIAKVMDECHIPYCFYGGDSIDSGYIADEATMIAQDAAFDNIMKPIPNGHFCRAVGNHDGFWNISAATGDEYHYTREQVYELFLREEAIAQNKHFGADGTYYYVEDIASKVRFIVLNTNDNDSDGGASVDSTQLSWLQNTALAFSESGWAVVFISHQPISNHYHANISNAAQVREIVSDSGVDVIGWFSGHIHRDRIYTGAAVNTTDDAEGDAMGFKQVTITSDHTGIAYDDATKHTVANDNQSHAIDFVTVNRSTRTVNLTRLGIGGDRSYTY